jgi:hypothetical protein
VSLACARIAIKPQVERYSRLYIGALIDELPTSVREHEAIIRRLPGRPGRGAARGETNWRNAAARLTGSSRGSAAWALAVGAAPDLPNHARRRQRR